MPGGAKPKMLILGNEQKEWKSGYQFPCHLIIHSYISGTKPIRHLLISETQTPNNTFN